jgi:hypothetical protein
MKNLLFNLIAVQTGSYKAEVGAGAGAETVSAPQYWWSPPYALDTGQALLRTIYLGIRSLMTTCPKCCHFSYGILL